MSRLAFHFGVGMSLLILAGMLPCDAKAIGETCKSEHQDIPLDFYFVLDLSRSTAHTQIFNLAEDFAMLCASGDRVAIGGFNRVLYSLSDSDLCTAEGAPPSIHQLLAAAREFENRPATLEEVVRDHWPHLVTNVQALEKGAFYTDFDGIADKVKEWVADEWRRRTGDYPREKNPEHRKRVVVLVSDGIPDPKGSLGLGWQDDPAQVRKWIEATERYSQWGLRAVVAAATAPLNGDWTVKMETSVWVVSDSPCPPLGPIARDCPQKHPPRACVSARVCEMWGGVELSRSPNQGLVVSSGRAPAIEEFRRYAQEYRVDAPRLRLIAPDLKSEGVNTVDEIFTITFKKERSYQTVRDVKQGEIEVTGTFQGADSVDAKRLEYLIIPGQSAKTLQLQVRVPIALRSFPAEIEIHAAGGDEPLWRLCHDEIRLPPRPGAAAGAP